MSKLLLLTVALAVVGIVWYAVSPAPGPAPQLDPEEWWGPRHLKGKEDRSIRPFQVNFSAPLVNDLKQRLKSHKKPASPLEDIGFQYGFNSEGLDSWIQYWVNKYPFQEREKFLNQFPQFKTNIQGLDIHFLRVKPKVPNNVRVVPLLLMHGWPGSVREFYEAIPLLTTPRDGYDFVFEVVVPSLPGFGFSDGATRPGMGPAQMSVIFRNLMRRLGFKQYYIQGGNWGAVVASSLLTLFPDEVLGHHSNLLQINSEYGYFLTSLASYFPSLFGDKNLVDRMYPLAKLFPFLMEESGYIHLQATKPDTLSTGLSDSPAGLLAYILEKFSSWTNFDNRALHGGGLKEFTKDQLIDNLMVYWSSNSISTSIRIYAEYFSNKYQTLKLDSYVSDVPTWSLNTKHELLHQPMWVVRTKYTNLLGNTVLQNGGHFIALEKPEAFAADVFKAVNEFRKWHAKKTEI